MKDAAQRGRIEGPVQLTGRSVPEHDPCMTAEHSTTARWIRLGVDFEEGGNRSEHSTTARWIRLGVDLVEG